MNRLLGRSVAVILLAAMVTACSESPTGRRQLILFSDESMAEMGASSFAELRAHSIPSANETLNRYISCVASHLTGRQTGEWELAVLNDEQQLNAFALPGNKIGVYSGLLQAARDQHQLATVVGHEIGHVLARHSNERFSTQVATQAGLQLLYWIWSGSNDGRPPNETALALLGLGASVGVMLPFSRAHEAEADQIGLMLMAEAGFDPQGSVALWSNMAEAEADDDRLTFLSTHPSHQSRARQLREHMPDAIKRQQAALATAAAPECAPAQRPAAAKEASGNSGRWQW